MPDKRVDYKELKRGGMMRQAERGRFAVRLRIVGGKLTAEAMEVINEVAKKYGSGEIHLTARQGIEIPNVSQEDLGKVKGALSAGGVKSGVCGPTVRTVTACQGSRVCPHGVLDSPEIARKVDELFYGKSVPTKFKVSISACVNNCLKAEENDIGIKGGVEPEWKRENCTYCGLCAAACPTDAIVVDKEGKILEIDFDKCIYCGDCIKACPFSAMQTGKKGFFVFAGGKFGRFPLLGKKINRFFEGEETVLKVVSAAIDFFRKTGIKKERFGNTLKRVGFDKFEDYILSHVEEEGEDEKVAGHNR